MEDASSAKAVFFQSPPFGFFTDLIARVQIQHARVIPTAIGRLGSRS